MSVLKTVGIKAALVAASLAFSISTACAAVDVAGVKYQETLPVGGKELMLNGAGVRTKFIIKVYTAGLYLQSKETTTEGVMKAEGPRRIRLVMMRDISSDDFGSAFMTGLNNNVSKEDKARIVGQISKYGEMFAAIPGLKKGDVLDTDYLPGQGAQSYLNGKKIGTVLPDLVFYNSVLRIWLGDKPADSSLKTKLLAGISAK
ncbi:chalcone isomerase family protein [Massilia sp. PAMC28688]|uniref:chalcone isomerase family protein n=1 Tax=Massilia sp. PAMC28688 TaxID=2861283 RepID=UPI001C63018E|nr:chalcone isomerase family protein [Massilia sp. PAMC28688]QYF93679.1 chalcone isomerase family protein [Massilia sp. PAMC28688]